MAVMKVLDENHELAIWLFLNVKASQRNVAVDKPEIVQRLHPVQHLQKYLLRLLRREFAARKAALEQIQGHSDRRVNDFGFVRRLFVENQSWKALMFDLFLINYVQNYYFPLKVLKLVLVVNAPRELGK
jgi:hypothetical protein